MRQNGTDRGTRSEGEANRRIRPMVTILPKVVPSQKDKIRSFKDILFKNKS